MIQTRMFLIMVYFIYLCNRSTTTVFIIKLNISKAERKELIIKLDYFLKTKCISCI